MKFIVLFFSAYILTLNVLPCGDLEQYGHGHEQEITAIDNHDEAHSHDHRDEADSCSPFCICACCGVISGFELIPFQLPISSVIQKEIFAVYQNNVLSNELIFIWKPPKIS